MVPGKRELVRSLLNGLGVTPRVLAAKRWLPARHLTVLAYHRVDDPAAAQEFDEGTLDASPTEFDEQVGLLSREFSIVGPDELTECVRSGHWPPNPAMITFDDGYRDNHDRALPILQRHRTKAFFFIATDYVTQRRVFWWDRISYTLKHAARQRFELTYPSAEVVDLANGVSAPARHLQGLVKRCSGLDIERFLAELAMAAGVAWDKDLEHALADRLVATWDQVRALKAAGMSIGSHTRSHRHLATVPPNELSEELLGSRSVLEEMLGEPVRAISYPVGGPTPYTPAVRAAIEAAGYQIGFTYGAGLSRLRALDPLNIGRLLIDGGWDLARFRAAVAYPWLG
ncbi:MAG: polysaccharide deacetylase family protein [Polyangiaceae bacterium]|nr:polysaccharide deacetylase family protein [Polyangiaceae bacterium]